MLKYEKRFVIVKNSISYKIKCRWCSAETNNSREHFDCNNGRNATGPPLLSEHPFCYSSRHKRIDMFGNDDKLI